MRFLREFGTGPDPAKRSRLQPERIGARGPNDPYTLSGLPLPMCYPPTCTEIYSNSLFASFKSFRIILLPPFLLPPASKPTLPPTYHKFFSFSPCSPQLVPSSDSIFLLFDTNKYICTSTSGYRCNADTNAMEHLSP